MTDDIDNDGTTLHESGGVVQPTDAQIDALRDHYKALGFPVDWYRAFARAVLALAVPQAPLQAEPVPVVASGKQKCPLCEGTGNDPGGLPGCRNCLGRGYLATPQAEQARDVSELKAFITNTIGFEWLEGELQTVNASDLLRIALASQSTPPPESAGQSAATIDPLQGAANWLVSALGPCGTTEIAWRLSIGNNRASRLYDAAILAANPTAKPDGGSKA